MIMMPDILYFIAESKSCVSREEFDSLKRELKYWQNTTISILKKYLIDNERKLNSRSIPLFMIVIYYSKVESEASHCPANDNSYLKDKVEVLDQKVEGILNQTQGNYNLH